MKIKNRARSVYLHIALDEVERSNCHVSETTAKDTAESTGGVELRRVHLDLLSRLIGRGDHE